MPFTITMPKLSPTMTEGTIAKWHKKEGDEVLAGELLLEVATDKATIEYHALDDGWLRQILIQEGEEAHVNQPIAVFTEKEHEDIEGYLLTKESQTENPIVQEVKKEEGEIEQKRTPSSFSTLSLQEKGFAPEPPPPEEGLSVPFQEKVKASPLARKLAKERGVDLKKLDGTGPGGRIVSRDIEQSDLFGGKGAPPHGAGTYEETPLTPMRKAIGERLQSAKASIPHFYVSQRVNMEPLVQMRTELKEMGKTFSYNDFLIRSCALALRRHPEINRGFNSMNQSLISFKTIDISIAVALPDGLVTPIIRHADYKTVAEIGQEVVALAEKARKGKLQPHEYRGGSFTVSNLGMYGINRFQAIINPPQGAILAVGGIEEAPVVQENQVVPGKVLELTLSLDHRVIDGASAAVFLKTLQKFMEKPSSLLM